MRNHENALENQNSIYIDIESTGFLTHASWAIMIFKRVKMIPLNLFKKHSIIASNLSKTILYSAEYRLLMKLSKTFSHFVTPPYELDGKKDKSLINYLQMKVIKLHEVEAENIEKGIYPASVILPKSPIDHIKNLPYIIFDSLRISRRRKLNVKKDIPENEETAFVPDYLKRNYHFQTDGYFSKRSAYVYEHQVEVLFSGTAAPMRRQLIKYLKNHLTKEQLNSGQLKILEIGAGVGSATLDFCDSFQFEQYVVTDISESYLDVSRERIEEKYKDASQEKKILGKIAFKKAAGESLPFSEGEFDIVFSIFLFHELPSEIRNKVLFESQRVLKPGGLLGICDSLQRDDDSRLNTILEQFPIDYHEPFYKAYTLWNVTESLEDASLQLLETDHALLSKYWVAKK